MAKKVAILLSHPIQYFSPLFKLMEEKFYKDFTVYYCTAQTIKEHFDKGFQSKIKWDVPLLEGYKYKFLKNYSWKAGTNSEFFNLINFGIIRILTKEKPDILIIHGWAYFTNWIAIFTAWLLGIEVWMKCESPLNQELKKSKKVKSIKRIILGKFLFRLISKFLYIGQQNKQFYLYHGVKECQLIFTPYAVDNNRFSLAYKSIISERDRLRNELGIKANETVILFSGKLIPKKRPLDLLEAFYNLNNGDAKLIYLGDGEMRGLIEEYISTKGLVNVEITGFKNQTELPVYYCCADIFVLPSEMGETWGLVANEAMNFNLPVIISDLAGSSSDLVIEGETGYSFKTKNVNDLTEKIKLLLRNKSLITQMGQNASNLISKYSYENGIMNMLKHLN